MKLLTQYLISICGRFSMNQKYTVKQTQLSDDLREKRRKPIRQRTCTYL